MLYKDEIKLITITRSKDSFGTPIETKTERRVMANKTDVFEREFYDASLIGVNAEIRFTINTGSYKDEEEIIYKGKAYRRIRKYEKGDSTILVCSLVIE